MHHVIQEKIWCDIFAQILTFSHNNASRLTETNTSKNK